MTLPDGRLLVFAHEAEAQAFEKIPHFVTGIGKVSASVALSRLLAQDPVREVIVLGTAGMLDDSLDLSTVYRVRKAIQHDLGFNPPPVEIGDDGRASTIGALTGKSGTSLADASTAPSQTDAQASDGSFHPLQVIPGAVIATGDAFVTDDELRKQLASEGAGLVDMESYSYARVAAEFQIPLHIYKVPSDFADSNTSDETWDDVVARKSHELLQFAQDLRLV